MREYVAIRRSILLAAIACTGALAFGAASAQAAPTAPPTVEFLFPSSVSNVSAALQTLINPNGGDTSCDIEYVDDATFSDSQYADATDVPCDPADLGDGTDDVSAVAQLTGLDLNTTYHFRVVATNDLGTTTTDDQTFVTLGAAAIDFEFPSNVTGTTAELDTNVNPLGNDTTCQFQWVDDATFQSSGYDNATTVDCSPQDLGAGTQDVSANTQLTGLTPSTTYHFRVVTTNTLGTATGSDTTFQTTAPVVIDSQSVAYVGSTTATLRAKLNPEGLDTHYQFQYVDDSAFQSGGFAGATTVPATPVDVGSGTTDAGASVDLTGLTPNTRYHFRVVATNTSGSANGAPQSFKTTAGAEAVGLPDGRGYEMVSPVDKADGELASTEIVAGSQSAPDGNTVGFFSFTSFPGSPGPGLQYIANRGATGWSTHTMLPRQAPGSSLEAPGYGLYSTDLSKAVLGNGNPAVGGGEDDPPLVPGEPRGPLNLFVRDNANNTFQLVNVTPAGATPADAHLDNGSADLSTVVFDEPAQLTPGASATTNNLYVWNAGKVSLIGVGASLGGPNPLAFQPRIFQAVSADGSRIFFTGADGNLNVFQHGAATQVDRTAGGTGPGGGGSYQVASVDGSVVFFTDADTAGLTANTVAGSGTNLYAYNVAAGTLTDMTGGQSAAQVDGVVGTSANGSYVYFVAEGALASGATAGQENLYVEHGGTTTFVATLGANDASDWNGSYTARVTPDGTRLAFESTQSLTGFDSTDTTSGTPDSEVFLYNAGSRSLVCASCNPTGARPLGPSTISPIEAGLLTGGNTYLQHNLSDDGSRLFFDSGDALAQHDSNGKSDVYEFAGGAAHLISTGTNDDNSLFIDASANGSDVFFITREQLVSRDVDGGYDLYDARVGGGFPESAPPPPCSADACRPGTTAAPPPPAQSTSAFSGPGNVKSSSGAKPKKSTVKVSTKALKGFRFSLTFQPSTKGMVTVSGQGLKSLKKAVKGGHSYKLTVGLTQKQRSALNKKHKHKLKVKVHIVFKPATGKPMTKSMSVTVKA